jgi:hypothetical protein
MLDPTICPQCFQPNEPDRKLCWKCLSSLAKPPSLQDYIRFFELRGSWGREDVKSAYLRLAKKYHPDANVGNREAHAFFKFVNQASEVLSPMSQEKVEAEERKKLEADPYPPADPSLGIGSIELYKKLLAVAEHARASETQQKKPNSAIQKFRKWLNQIFSKSRS